MHGELWISNRATVCLILLARLGLSGAPRSVHCATESENLILHRPYQMAPALDYAPCIDPGDATQLTDGQTDYLAGRICFTSLWPWGTESLPQPLATHLMSSPEPSCSPGRLPSPDIWASSARSNCRCRPA